jgi:hypothetical protein
MNMEDFDWDAPIRKDGELGPITRRPQPMFVEGVGLYSGRKTPDTKDKVKKNKIRMREWPQPLPGYVPLHIRTYPYWEDMSISLRDQLPKPTSAFEESMLNRRLAEEREREAIEKEAELARALVGAPKLKTKQRMANDLRHILETARRYHPIDEEAVQRQKAESKDRYRVMPSFIRMPKKK